MRPSLEKEIKVLHDFLYDHAPVEEKHAIYIQMRDEFARSPHYLNEVDLLCGVLQYRREQYK